jgi:deoxyribose-phosphate aldolase
MNIAAYIDHTVLKPGTTLADVKQLCAEAIEQQFAAVCVPPFYVAAAKELLQTSNVKVATVIGFPFGYSILSSKLQEIKEAIADGADELDMVHSIAALKSGDWDYLLNEVKACTELVHKSGKVIKLIVESGILTEAELIQCCQLYAPLDIDFMKTSTGYAEKGATIESVKTMRRYLPESIAIKASGGIRTFAFAKELVDAGATRIGCSAGIQIVKESKAVNLQA